MQHNILKRWLCEAFQFLLRAWCMSCFWSYSESQKKYLLTRAICSYGLVEYVNKALNSMMCEFIHKDECTWDWWLDPLLFPL